MAEIKAEDDDEEGFGDFTFASFPNQSTLPSSGLTNGRNSIAVDEDEWGDFVEFPLRSDLSTDLSRTLSVPNPSGLQKPLESFDFFSDHSTKPSTRSDSGSGRVESDETRWMKPKGALPLSLFGDAEDDEEDQSGVDDSSIDVASKDPFAKTGTNNQSIGEVNDVISNLYSQSQQIKAGNGFNSEPSMSNLNLDATKLNTKMNGFTWDLSWSNANSDTTLDNQDQLIKAENGLFSNPNGSKLNFDDGTHSYSNGLDLNMKDSTWSLSEFSMITGLVAGNQDFEIFSSLYSQSQQIAESGQSPNSNPLNSNSNVSTSSGRESNLVLNSLTSNLSGLNANSNGLISNLDAISANEESEGDDDGWEFKDAFSELKIVEGEPKVIVKGQETAKAASDSSGFGYGLHGPNDLFATSNGFLSQSNGVDISFDFKPLTAAQNGFSSDSYSQGELKGNENGLSSDPIARAGDSDEDFGEFEYAFSETALKQEEEVRVNDLSHFEVETSKSDGKTQGNELKSDESQKRALPLSIFGDEELETDDSFDSQNIFMSQPATDPRNGFHSQGSNLSINDLISSLYSQDEQIRSVDSTRKPAEVFLDSITTLFDSNIENADDEINDDSWEFQDASSYTGDNDESTIFTPKDSCQNSSARLKLDNFVDFYSKLRDELCYVATSHLGSQKAQNGAALSGEDIKLAALLDEIQEACKELPEVDVLSEQVHLEDHPPRVICLDDFLEALQDPKFHVLELEYSLSTRLQFALTDLASAIELLKHATSALNVLKLGSSEEQSIYVSTWSKIITVCAQELKHGAWIWKQSLEKNVHNQILSESGGKQYILALGEIYRVLVIIGASAKLYKPWILSTSSDPTGIYALLEDCYMLWKSSGLEDALHSMSDPTGTEDSKTLEGLRESIKYVHEFDAPAIGKHVFSQEESKCRISLLTLGAVPDMKMVEWNGEHYLVKLANLWANTISSDPPNIPHIHVG